MIVGKIKNMINELSGKKLMLTLKQTIKDKDIRIEYLEKTIGLLNESIKDQIEMNDYYRNTCAEKEEFYHDMPRKDRLKFLAERVAIEELGCLGNCTIEEVNDSKIEIHAIGVSASECWCDGGVVKTIEIK